MKRVIFIIKNTLKFLLFIIFISFIVIIFMQQPSAHEECIESGVCLEGLKIKDSKTGNLYTVNEKNCYKYNGIWKKNKNRNNKMFCYFR